MERLHRALVSPKKTTQDPNFLRQKQCTGFVFATFPKTSPGLVPSLVFGSMLLNFLDDRTIYDFLRSTLHLEERQNIFQTGKNCHNGCFNKALHICASSFVLSEHFFLKKKCHTGCIDKGFYPSMFSHVLPDDFFQNICHGDCIDKLFPQCLFFSKV